jgi:tartrate dehydratase beta subunit/fumarate hydratase class I family protein
MTEYHLESPLSEDDIRKLQLRDIIYVSGDMYSGTAHMPRIIEAIQKGEKLPFDLKGVVFSQGATTSARYQHITVDLIKYARVGAIIGKGSINKACLEAMEKYGCVYLSLVGGATGPQHTLKTRRYRESLVERVQTDWPEPGPRSLVVMKVKDYGPLFVTMDAHGNSVETEIEKSLEEKLPQIYSMLSADAFIPYHF